MRLRGCPGHRTPTPVGWVVGLDGVVNYKQECKLHEHAAMHPRPQPHQTTDGQEPAAGQLRAAALEL